MSTNHIYMNCNIPLCLDKMHACRCFFHSHLQKLDWLLTETRTCIAPAPHIWNTYAGAFPTATKSGGIPNIDDLERKPEVRRDKSQFSDNSLSVLCYYSCSAGWTHACVSCGKRARPYRPLRASCLKTIFLTFREAVTLQDDSTYNFNNLYWCSYCKIMMPIIFFHGIFIY